MLWGMMDSNHRSILQNVYSVPPLPLGTIPRVERVDGLEPTTGSLESFSSTN